MCNRDVSLRLLNLVWLVDSFEYWAVTDALLLHEVTVAWSLMRCPRISKPDISRWSVDCCHACFTMVIWERRWRWRRRRRWCLLCILNSKLGPALRFYVTSPMTEVAIFLLEGTFSWEVPFLIVVSPEAAPFFMLSFFYVHSKSTCTWIAFA